MGLKSIWPLPGAARLGEWTLLCTSEFYGGQPQTPFEFWLDQAAVPALTARSRQTGDRLTLPGRPTKSLKKWYIDEKIPRFRRDQLPVLSCAGQVAAAAGLGPDRAFLPQIGAAAWHIRVTEESPHFA